MNLRLSLIIISSLITSSSASLTLHCDFINDGWDSSITSVYKCEVQQSSLNITSRDNSVISKIIGKSTSNDKVNAFRAFEQVCHFFPQHLLKFFKNIEAIAVQNSQLKDLTKADLKDFKNLKSLSLYGNELKSLEFGIFDENFKLEFLSLYNNKIATVGSKILHPLKNLKKVFFHNNLCVNYDASNVDELTILISKLTSDCPPTQDLIKLHKNQEKLAKFETDFDKLYQKFSTLKNQIKNCEDRNENLTKHVELSNSTCAANEILAFELSRCDSKLKDLTTLITKFQIDCESFNDGTCIADDVITFYDEMEVVSAKFNGSELNQLDVKTLEISGRNFYYMPMSFEYFGRLENLTVTNTRIYFFEKFESNLTILKLSDNQIERINEIKMERLEVFDLSHNKIEEIPGIFEKLTSLKEIYLDFNQISVLRWKIFAKNLNIEVISLRGNKLSQIGSNLEVVGSIKNAFNGDWDDFVGDDEKTTEEPLMMEETTQKAPSTNLQSTNLKFLDLTDNHCINSQYPTSNLSSMVQTFSSNCLIYIEINAQRDPQTYKLEYTEVDAENTKIYQNFTSNVTKFVVNEETFEYSPRNLQEIFINLKSIEIFQSKLKKIPKFENLIEIHVIGNEVTKLEPKNFDKSLNVELIDISKNKIKNLPPGIFSKLVKLKVINLNWNHLATLSSDIIVKSNSIMEFHCASNPLEEINPEIIKMLKTAKLIDLSGNSCIDNKFKHGEYDFKKIMEIYGEIVFKCGA